MPKQIIFKMTDIQRKDKLAWFGSSSVNSTNPLLNQLAVSGIYPHST
jgi:hypothetical protein